MYDDFEKLLDEMGEVGYVAQVIHPLVYVRGLPKASPNEFVRTEAGDFGQVISLSDEYAEIMMFSSRESRVGERIVRLGEVVSLSVSERLLGAAIDPLGRLYGAEKEYVDDGERRPIYGSPPEIFRRKNITDPLETGVSLVDVIVPLGKGQRELVIGDRRVGRGDFLKQAFLAHARRGGVCVWAAIGRRGTEVLAMQDFVRKFGLEKNSVIVATSSIDSAGLVYLAPYSAMTVAEYFRDKGMDVLVVLDDLTTHAKYYREITLLAKRFPGRSAYPGDIFYAHSRLMERAGNFVKGSITCLPVAETVFGDISGYIQTNLMSMTDGHIFFDQNLFNQGRRPAINPFLSVTRVGRQTQTALFKSLSQELTRFLVELEKVKELLHFGGEIGNDAKIMLAKGELVMKHFDQGGDQIMPLTVNAYLMAGIWAGFWEGDVVGFNDYTAKLLEAYESSKEFRDRIDAMVVNANVFSDLVDQVSRENAAGSEEGSNG